MDIKTLEDFREACAHHDLTHGYSDDSRYYRAGAADLERIQKAAEQFPREDVERIWNEMVDQKLVPVARAQFYWRWQPPAITGRPQAKLSVE